MQFGCFVEGCERKCSTPQKRRRHLIDKHMFPRVSKPMKIFPPYILVSIPLYLPSSSCLFLLIITTRHTTFSSSTTASTSTTPCFDHRTVSVGESRSRNRRRQAGCGTGKRRCLPAPPIQSGGVLPVMIMITTLVRIRIHRQEWTLTILPNPCPRCGLCQRVWRRSWTVASRTNREEVVAICMDCTASFLLQGSLS